MKRTPTTGVSEPKHSDELTGVLNVAVRDIESNDDKEILERILPIIEDFKTELLARRIRRISRV